MMRARQAALSDTVSVGRRNRPPLATLVTLGEGDAQRYRCEHLAQHLEALGFLIRLVGHRSGVRFPVGPCDLLVLHRIPADRYLLAQCRRIQAEGGLVAVDLDDLVFEPREVGRFARDLKEPLARRIAVVGDAGAIRAGIGVADLALAATQPLQEVLRGLCRRVEWYGNSYSHEMLRLSEEAYGKQRETNREVVLGYASGTPTHELDFAGIVPVLANLLTRFPQVRLRIIGFLDPGEGLRHFGDRVERRSFVPWSKLPGELADLDVNLVPLEANRPFCRMKSEVKFLEAALVRVPTIADGTPAFRSAIQDGENGFIAESANEWQEKLVALIADPELRRRFGARAHADVIGGYSPAARIRELRGILRRLTGVDHGRTGRWLIDGNTVSVADFGEARESVPPSRHRERAGVFSKGMYFLRYEPMASVLRRLLVFVLIRASRASVGGWRSPHGR